MDAYSALSESEKVKLPCKLTVSISETVADPKLIAFTDAFGKSKFPPTVIVGFRLLRLFTFIEYGPVLYKVILFAIVKLSSIYIVAVLPGEPVFPKTTL